MTPGKVCRAGALLGLLTAFPLAQHPPEAKFKLLSVAPGQYSEHTASIPTSVPQYDLPANRLIFTQREVRLVVVAGAYDFDGTFMINGLANPDIQLVRGARVIFDVINLAPTGGRYFLIVSEPPPYDPPLTMRSIQEQLPPQWAQWRPCTQMGRGARDHILPGRNCLGAIADVKANYIAETVGEAYYIGMTPFDRDGEYGRIIVVP